MSFVLVCSVFDPLLVLESLLISCLVLDLYKHHFMVCCKADEQSETMAIKRERKILESSDSDDLTTDDSVSDSDWSTRTRRGTSAKTARADVAVDYSIASSSSQNTSGPSSGTKPSTTPRRHTGPRKPRVHEKVRVFNILCSRIQLWIEGRLPVNPS